MTPVLGPVPARQRASSIPGENSTAMKRLSYAVPAVVLFAARPAFAAGGDTDLSTFFKNIATLVTGTAGTSLAVVAVMVVGLAMMFNAMERGLGGKVIFGIGLVFSAAWIVDQLVT